MLVPIAELFNHSNVDTYYFTADSLSLKKEANINDEDNSLYFDRVLIESYLDNSQFSYDSPNYDEFRVSFDSAIGGNQSI